MNIKRLPALVLINFIIAFIGSYGYSIAAVELLYFITVPGTNSIMLYWETASEIDNAGYRVHRSLEISTAFEPISPFIPASIDPFAGSFYSYEDADVEIGIQYYYILEIISTDGISDFTEAVGAIIAAPTATGTLTPTGTPTPTRTLTATRTLTPITSPSLTLTSTQTKIMSATRTATMVLNTATVTLTPQPTATVTHTPTTTLDPFEIDELGFPVILLTGSRTPQNTTNPDYLTPASPIVEEVPTESSRYLYVIVIAVWLVLAAFIVIFIRRIIRNVH